MRKPVTRDDFPNAVVITYDYDLAPDVLERWMWTGTLNTNAFDYHTKEQLILKAEAKGLPWVVLKRSRNGQLFIHKKSKQLNKQSKEEQQ